MVRWLITLLVLVRIGYSQNLVPNPSFECGEDLICAPYQIPDIQEFSKHACGWTVPGFGTSDIFYLNSISFPGCYLRMPNIGVGDVIGSQFPRTGNRFAGIYGYSKNLGGDTVSYREYLQVKLSHTLIPGEKYCAEMYVSSAEKVLYYSNNLAFRFNTNEIFVSDYKYLNLKPQIMESNIISDTSNWVRIGGIFETSEPSNYLVIGNFYGDGSTQSIIADQVAHVKGSYYFIDDVSVEKVPNDKFTIVAPHSICEGDTVQIIASAGVENITWTTLEDTVEVINLGEKFVVSPAKTSSYRVKSTGCKKNVIDTITLIVNARPKVELGKDTILCTGQKLKLNAGSGFVKYSWQDNSSFEIFEVTEGGRYSVEVTDIKGCKGRDQIHVKYIDAPKVDLGNDTLICKTFYSLVAGGDEYDYEWMDGSIQASIKVAFPGTYWVKAQNKCGIGTDTITLHSIDDIFIPNVITANDDSINDHFVLGLRKKDGTMVTNSIPTRITIYNRWGSSIYENATYSNEWPRPGQEVNAGIYFYRIQFYGCKDFKGWLQLIR